MHLFVREAHVLADRLLRGPVPATTVDAKETAVAVEKPPGAASYSTPCRYFSRGTRQDKPVLLDVKDGINERGESGRPLRCP